MPARTHQTHAQRSLIVEIAIVLTITFGMSGLRSLLKLIGLLLAPKALNEQETTLNNSQAAAPWLDLALQLCSALSLTAWGFLALFLLVVHRPPVPGTPRTILAHVLGPLRGRSLLSGLGLAALIGIPGLAFYLGAVALGLSTQVIPSGLGTAWWAIPVLLIWSFANAFAEEVVVVAWLSTRLRQLRLPTVSILLCSALLRGSYHLYQGLSAGLGNIIMGLIFTAFYLLTGKTWPLIIAHFLIDAVAFVGYALLGSHLSFL